MDLGGRLSNQNQHMAVSISGYCSGLGELSIQNGSDRISALGWAMG